MSFLDQLLEWALGPADTASTSPKGEVNWGVIGEYREPKVGEGFPTEEEGSDALQKRTGS